MMQGMLSGLILCSISIISVIHAQPSGSRWSILRQNDYDIKVEIAKIESFNSSYFKYAKLDAVPYNRTLRALNGSFEVSIELPQKLTVGVKTEKFLSNEYRFFPLSFQFDACMEYNHDSFGLKEMFDSCSNIRPCSVKKDLYLLINALPDFSKFPPHIPFGRYSWHFDVFHTDVKLINIVGYVEVKEKPKY